MEDKNSDFKGGTSIFRWQTKDAQFVFQRVMGVDSVVVVLRKHTQSESGEILATEILSSSSLFSSMCGAHLEGGDAAEHVCRRTETRHLLQN